MFTFLLFFGEHNCHLRAARNSARTRILGNLVNVSSYAASGAGESNSKPRLRWGGMGEGILARGIRAQKKAFHLRALPPLERYELAWKIH
jgi:hypothetical protein